MANKNFAPSMTFTESEKRLPKTESAGATRTGVILTANSGYGNIPINIRTETQLIDMFGYPTETNYKMWFDCAGYLKYASELYVIRPVIDATWANYGIGIDPSENVTSVNKTNMYNPDIAEATLDTATVTSANKIEFYNKSISTNDDIAVLVCSKEADFTSPIVDEDAVLLHSTYIHADTPVIDASEGTATIATVANTVLTHGYSIIAEDPSDLETYYVYRYNANTTAWVQGDAIATTALIFTDEKSAVLTVTNRKKFGNLAWSNTEVTEVGGAGTFTHLDPQPKSYKKIKNTTTNFISYVVPHYLATSLYNSSTGLATTYENLIKPEPDFGAYELGVIVLKKDVQGYWQLAETFVGSWVETAKTTSGLSKFIQTIINKNSNYVYCIAEAWTLATEDEYEFSTMDSMVLDMILADGGSTDYSDPSEVGTDDLETSAEIFGTNGVMNPEILIGFDNQRTAGYLDTMPRIAEETGFSVAVVSLYNDESLVGLTEENINQGIIDSLGNLRDDTSIGALTEFNSYTMAFGQMKYFYDKYNDKYRWVPISGDMAGLMSRNDNLYGVQSPLAGYNRGDYNNFAKLLSKGTYDQNLLSKNGINQIIFDYDNQNYVLFEFLTNTQLDLIVKEANIRRMIIYIKQFLRKTLRGNFFEFNNETTRKITLFRISNLFSALKSAGGLFDYLLICDETNNTPERINANEFVLDVRLQPNRVIKHIYINITNYDMGLDITENE